MTYKTNLFQVREACAPRVTRQFPFSSDRKRMSTLVESRGGGDGGAAMARLHLKGAAELVLDLCTARALPDGSVQVPVGRCSGQVMNE